jgi:acetylornithine deacetylase/succinyl-diaminopimelate desuccinylase-like protein
MNEKAVAKSLVAILSDLIAIPSPYPPGESVDICRYAAARLKKAGYKVQVLARKKGVDNVVAKMGKGSPRIVFNAHVDTVGVGDRENWKTDPFKAVVKNGHVFGLGAGNCKGSMAVQLWLAEEIARRGGPVKGEVCFTFVADEENLGPEGMSFLRDKGHVKPDALILGAQTENQMIVSERGVFWARITTKGKAAHAGNPGAGDNAIARMTRLLAAIDTGLAPRIDKRVDGPMRSTMNVGMIRGGHNTNVVPASCMVEIDRRLLPSERVKSAYKELVDTLKRRGRAEGQLGLRVPHRHQRLQGLGQGHGDRGTRRRDQVAPGQAGEVPQRDRRLRRPLLRRRQDRDHQYRPRLRRRRTCGERVRADRRDGGLGGHPARCHREADGAAMRRARAALAGAALAAVAASAVAQDIPIETGTPFKLARAVPAPWVTAPARAVIPGALRGKPITFAQGRVAGPHPLACNQARYVFTIVPPEGLFQGNLPAPQPAAAQRFGLGAQTLTMQLSCSTGVFDFHVASSTRLLLALDNVVWTLDRAAGPAPVPPDTIVQRVLLDHFTHDMAFTPETAARKRAWFTPSLNRAIATYFAQKFPEDEPPPINGDPITNSQDYPTRFEIARAAIKGRAATVRVTFADEGRSRPTDFRLRKSDGGAWRIDDLAYDDGSTFRQSLAARP